ALAVEERPTALRRGADRLLVAGDPPVERRPARQLRALERRDRGGEVVERPVAAERLLERGLILRDREHLLHDGGAVRLAHLDRVRDRKLRLVLERRGAAVPELRRVEDGVQHGRAVPLRLLLRRGDALGERLAVDEALRRIVARRARDLVVRREADVVEELL